MPPDFNTALLSAKERIAFKLRGSWSYTQAPGFWQRKGFQQLAAKFYEQLWLEAAHHLGAKFQKVQFGYYYIRHKDLLTVVRGAEVMADNHLMLELMGNKILTVELLKQMRCPVHDISVFDITDRRKMERFCKFDQRLVVKPAYGTGGGAGVTTGITNVRTLRKAVRSAARFGSTTALQTELPGDSYRLLFLGGNLIDAIRRAPPVLIGNGTDTVRKLIRAENAERLSRNPIVALHPIRIDQECKTQLHSLGLSLNSRLAEGQVIRVKGVANENSAQQNHNVLGTVHPSTAAVCANVARNLSLELAGIDIQCRDISRPLGPGNGAIIEVNTTPGLHHHYLISDRSQAVPVAELILRRIFDTGEGAITIRNTRAA